MTSLGLGYAAAGLVATSSTVGMALGAPWRGRAVDRLGLRRALVPSIVAEALVWGTAPFVGYHLLLAVAFVGGVLGLPVFTVARQSLSVLVTEEQRRTAFSLDSIGVEVSFMVGPAAGVVVATQVSSTVALLGVGVLMVAAGLALVVADPPTRSTEAEQAAQAAAADGTVAGGARTWFSPGLAAVLGASAAGTLVLSARTSASSRCCATTARYLTGVVFAAWSIGSILGAIVYGALRRPVSPRCCWAGSPS